MPVFRLAKVAPRASMFDSFLVKRVERIDESRNSPAEHVIVGKHAAVDSCASQASNILWTHLVVNVLAKPVRVAARNRSL